MDYKPRMEHISNIIDRAVRQEQTPISTGIKFLDNRIGGYFPGELTTICGGENCCKTAFVIRELCHIAVDQGIPTLVVQTNMSEYIFLASMAAYYCCIDTDCVQQVLNAEEHRENVEHFLDKLRRSPIFFVSSDAYEDKTFFGELEKIISDNGIKIAFVDEAIRSESEERKKGYVCHLKRLAMKMNIPVVATFCVNVIEDDEISKSRSLEYLWFFGDFHGSDVVIGFRHLEQDWIHYDERVKDLQGMIGLEILKYRGLTIVSKTKIPVGHFYYRDFNKWQKQHLEKLRQSNKGRIDALISRLGLVVADGPM